jgi:hypothetical protein
MELTKRSVEQLRKISPLDRCFCFVAYLDGPMFPQEWDNALDTVNTCSALGAMTKGRLALYKNMSEAEKNEGPETWHWREGL